MTVSRCLAAAALAAAAFTPLPAHAAEPPTGEGCAFLSVNHPAAGETTWTTVLYGGPVAAPGAVVTLRCSIHVGNTSHTGPAAMAASTSGLSVATLAPATGTYTATVDDVVALCTEVTVDGVAWYRSGDTWTTDGTTPCALASTVPDDGCYYDLSECVDPVIGLLPDEVVSLIAEVICYVSIECSGPDPVVCAALRALRPGVPGVVDVRDDGDLYLAGEFFWDCPPYEIF